jgi:hypothetical protein
MERPNRTSACGRSLAMVNTKTPEGAVRDVVWGPPMAQSCTAECLTGGERLGGFSSPPRPRGVLPLPSDGSRRAGDRLVLLADGRRPLRGPDIRGHDDAVTGVARTATTPRLLRPEPTRPAKGSNYKRRNWRRNEGFEPQKPLDINILQQFRVSPGARFLRNSGSSYISITRDRRLKPRRRRPGAGRDIRNDSDTHDRRRMISHLTASVEIAIQQRLSTNVSVANLQRKSVTGWRCRRCGALTRIAAGIGHASANPVGVDRPPRISRFLPVFSAKRLHISTSARD